MLTCSLSLRPYLLPVRGIRILTWDLNTVRLGRLYWDLVMVNFVLNVLDTEEERLDVVRRPRPCLRPGLLWLCTRSRRHIDQLGTKKGWARTPNGSWLSSPSKRTVQFGMDSDHLEALCHRSGVSLTRLSLPGNPTSEARAVLMRIID